MAAPLLAELLGGTPFLGFIAAVAFATILAVVAGPHALRRRGAVARSLGERGARGATPTPREQLRVARLATLALGVVAVALGITFKGQNVAFMVSLAFAIAASANFPALMLVDLLARLHHGRRGHQHGAGHRADAAADLSLAHASRSTSCGRDSAWFPLKNPALITMPLSFLAGIVVSLLAPERSAPTGTRRSSGGCIWGRSSHDTDSPRGTEGTKTDTDEQQRFCCSLCPLRVLRASVYLPPHAPHDDDEGRPPGRAVRCRLLLPARPRGRAGADPRGAVVGGREHLGRDRDRSQGRRTGRRGRPLVHRPRARRRGPGQDRGGGGVDSRFGPAAPAARRRPLDHLSGAPRDAPSPPAARHPAPRRPPRPVSRVPGRPLLARLPVRPDHGGGARRPAGAGRDPDDDRAPAGAGGPVRGRGDRDAALAGRHAAPVRDAGLSLARSRRASSPASRRASRTGSPAASPSGRCSTSFSRWRRRWPAPTSWSSTPSTIPPASPRRSPPSWSRRSPPACSWRLDDQARRSRALLLRLAAAPPRAPPPSTTPSCGRRPPSGSPSTSGSTPAIRPGTSWPRPAGSPTCSRRKGSRARSSTRPSWGRPGQLLRPAAGHRGREGDRAGAPHGRGDRRRRRTGPSIRSPGRSRTATSGAGARST